MIPFSISTEHSQQASVVHVSGYLDAHTANGLETTLDELVRSGVVRIIIDFENLEYISSAGLGVFMVFIEDVRAKHGDIVFASMKPSVYSVFDLLGFPILFRIVPTVSEALALFSVHE